MDLAAYGLGQTDSFQGTGVFSSIKFEREPAADNKPEETTKEKDAKTTTTDQK
jgi:hypothetical protein